MLTIRLTARSVRVLAIPLLLAGLVTAIAPAASAAIRHPSASPARSLPSGFAFGVATISAGRAWAVGQTLGRTTLSSFKTLTLRWGGSSWTRVASPNPSAGAQLNAVAAASAGNAWAVGNTNGTNPKPYIIHWNGRAWAHVPSPALADGGALFSVTATSQRNAWAVGCAGNCFRALHAIKTLILHWNGTAWKRVPSPSPGLGSNLTGVAATSASSAWAVGCTAFCEISSASPQTLILRWNGTRWKHVPSPATATTGALNGVTAISGHAWAVGCTGHCFGPAATTSTMILAWNGASWSQVPSPSPAGNSVLTSVTATSASNAWAAGYTRVSGTTLIERWNGISWTQVPSPTPGGTDAQLLGVAASASNAWAVGYNVNAKLVLLHWNGVTWK